MLKALLDMFMGFLKSEQTAPIGGMNPDLQIKKDEVEEPFVVKNIIDELAKHATRTWNTRKVSGIEYVAVHQVAGPGSISGIAKYHTRPGEQNHLSEKGAPGISYHYGIDKDGTCYQLTEDKYLTWHCAGKNTKALSVLVVGNFNGPGHEGTEEPTKEQIQALPKLLDYLKGKYPAIKVVGHGEHAAASHKKDYCPGDVVQEAINTYRS